MSRSPVASYTPGFVEALKLAWRPMLAYLVFCGLGFAAFTAVIVVYESGDDLVQVGAAVAAGFAGIVGGQLVSLFRVRIVPLWVLTFLCFSSAFWLVSVTGFDLPKTVILSLAFFCFALPCGLLSLQHRWELVAAFWPTLGWVGSAVMILNHEGRVAQWHEDKAFAWLPVPLLLLGGFTVTLLLYLAAKQSMRVDLWQALSGAAQRRIQKRDAVRAIPRRNVLALLALSLVLFAFTAVLAPYLWRTGRGDRRGSGQTEEPADPDGPRMKAPDGEAIQRMLRQLAEAAKKTSALLWPLLLLLLLYRPAKRALLTTHLKTPVVPTPPSERIDNLWELVRIRAEDAGLALKPSDSVEELLVRARAADLATPELHEAAAIYARTRYGLAVRVGDPLAMRRVAPLAAAGLVARLSLWAHVRAWFRGLS